MSSIRHTTLVYSILNHIKRHTTQVRHLILISTSPTDSEISSLSRGEAVVQSEHGSNPPPSPATDARDCSSDTDGHTDGHVDTPHHTDARIDHPDARLDHPDARLGHPDARIGHPAARIDHPDAHIGSTVVPPHGIPPDPRALQEYDDGDFLEVMCNDDMDLF